MKERKSLRQLAKELGVTHSYLSQVISGKRPASEKLVSKLAEANQAQSGKQLIQHLVGQRDDFSFEIEDFVMPSKQWFAGSNPSRDATFGS